MAAGTAKKKETKKDLEDKIAALEAKLSQISEQVGSNAGAAAEPAKPKGTLPKGFGDAPKPAPKPA
ncbi:MAG: trans-sialidase, partial [Nitrosopumilus sp.]|nr:trans-sialidase [Nitrosopumilus sp.]